MNSENLTKLSKKKSQNNLRIITERNFQKKKYKKDGGISNQFLENILKNGRQNSQVFSGGTS